MFATTSSVALPQMTMYSAKLFWAQRMWWSFLESPHPEPFEVQRNPFTKWIYIGLHRLTKINLHGLIKANIIMSSSWTHKRHTSPASSCVVSHRMEILACPGVSGTCWFRGAMHHWSLLFHEDGTWGEATYRRDGSHKTIPNAKHIVPVRGYE